MAKGTTTKKIILSKIPTRAPENLEKKRAKKISEARFREIADLQNLMAAEGKHSLLIIFQGMDGSGKDGATRNLFRYCTPAGIDVVSFKKPTDEEFAHDFLWRVHKRTPAKGTIAIFNRSHYEDILIQRVHGWIDNTRVKKRMAAINAFEDLLQFDNNTTVLKFYLHISKEQQELELQERIDEPEKHFKHNPGDWEERKHWDKYRTAYEYAINNSTTPWHIVPVDQRWYRDYVMSEIIVNTMKSFKMKYPPLEKE
ncbi:MAG: PPK2 family polyphosphate kinase [Bacteroidota bacterium]